MHEILVGFSLIYWNNETLIQGIEEISEFGFPGFEGTPHLVSRYEDRIDVFSEILARTDIELIAIVNQSNFLIDDKREEEVEIDMNIARFLHNVGAQFLVVTCGPRRPEGNTDQDWKNLVESLEELGERSLDSSITLCVMPFHGTIVSSAEDIDRLMESTSSDKVKLCVDIGECRASLVDSVELMDKYFDRIPYVRFRDVLDRRMIGRAKDIRKARKSEDRIYQPVGVPFGRGLSQMKRAWDFLSEREFEGWTMAVVEEPRSRARSVLIASRDYLEEHMELIF
ncbi:MAG: TIM barrel protein [Planctomycetota bacterium]|nr:TIM barrel protein [Planctomycetota bacterium]